MIKGFLGNDNWLKKLVDALTNRVGTTESNVNALTGRMETTESNVSGLTNRVGDLESGFTNHKKIFNTGSGFTYMEVVYNTNAYRIQINGSSGKPKLYRSTDGGVTWSSNDDIVVESNLTTLTEGTCTPGDLMKGASVQNVRVVKNNMTGLCTVTGEVILGSISISAGAVFTAGNISSGFRPTKDVHGTFLSFHSQSTPTVVTDAGKNMIYVCLSRDGNIYAAIPYAKASGTQGHTIPFHFAFYTQ